MLSRFSSYAEVSPSGKGIHIIDRGILQTDMVLLQEIRLTVCQ